MNCFPRIWGESEDKKEILTRNSVKKSNLKMKVMRINASERRK